MITGTAIVLLASAVLSAFAIAYAISTRLQTQLHRRINRLARRFVQAHVRPVATAGVKTPRGFHIKHPTVAALKEEPLNHKASVAGLLGSAAGAAEALTDCGLDCDDTELVTDLLARLDQIHAKFVLVVAEHRQELLDQGVPLDALNDPHTTLRLSMQSSPAIMNLHTLWRLCCYLKRSASPDVLEAARAVVGALDSATRNRALAKLAAALPKED